MDAQVGHTVGSRTRVKASSGAGMNLSKSEKGAHFVELALAIPLFIGLLFGMFDMARLALGYSALHSAVYQGTRRGIGYFRPANNTSLASVFSPPSNIAAKGALSGVDFLVNGVNSGDATSWYTSNIEAPMVFKAEALAAGYAYKIIERSFGGLKWPCEEAGCVACAPNRDKLEYLNLFCDPGLSGAAGNCSNAGTAVVPVAYLGIECSLYVPIMTTSVFLGWLPDKIHLRATAYVSVDNYTAAEGFAG